MTERIQLGQRYGRLTVLGNSEPTTSPSGKRRPRMACQCDCGRSLTVLTQSLRSGASQSCGCLQRETVAAARKHGHAASQQPRSGTYISWAQMRSRCNNPRVPEYRNYGGRGIKVCARWDSFEAFLQDMGPRPEGMTVERNDVHGDYEPSNCRWATRGEQATNTTRSRRLEVGGRVLTLSQWASETGLSAKCISSRLRRGWAVDRAVQP